MSADCHINMLLCSRFLEIKESAGSTCLYHWFWIRYLVFTECVHLAR